MQIVRLRLQSSSIVLRIPHPRANTAKPKQSLDFVWVLVFAEDVGFEPTRSFTLWRFSKPLPSATRPILQYIHFVQTVALRGDWPGVCHALRYNMKQFMLYPLGQSSIYFAVLKWGPLLRFIDRVARHCRAGMICSSADYTHLGQSLSNVRFTHIHI